MIRTRTLLVVAISAAVFVGASASAASAGELTGNGKPTAGPAHANSICVFSGQNDDPTAPLSLDLIDRAERPGRPLAVVRTGRQDRSRPARAESRHGMRAW